MCGSVSLNFRILAALGFLNHFTTTATNTSTQSSCLMSQYRCATGDCIPLYSVCDGLRGCWDGSDETKEACDSVRINSEKKGCKLPEQPQNGSHESPLCLSGDNRIACRNIPGTPVPENWLVEYKCDANFTINSTESEYSVCLDGEWKNPLSCIKLNLCPPLVSIDKNVVCEYNGREVPCTESMRPNTKASASCKPHYKKTYKDAYDAITCLQSGEWSHRPLDCTPECGIPRKIDNPSSLEPLITRGSSTYHGQFPWLAAIYMLNENNQWDFRCAGTLIDTHIILTAAHCLVDEIYGVHLKPKNIKVGLGKYYRYYYKEENNSVISEVSSIHVPPSFTGRANFFEMDIGLIDLKTSVLLTDYIMPACMDWGSHTPYYTGFIGQVAGWGATENGLSSNVILTTNLTYIDKTECLEPLNDSQKKLVTYDKFCGKAADSGGQVAAGDSGGGLTVVKDGLHYMRGVVSTKISDKTDVSFFSSLDNYRVLDWLEQETNRLFNLRLFKDFDENYGYGQIKQF